MSSKSQNLEICFFQIPKSRNLFLYSVTIYNDSAFYFFEMIVLISLERTPTQIRMRVRCITFHARGLMMGQYVFFMSKSWNIYMYTLFSYYLQRLSPLFLEMSVIILVGTLTQIRMGLGCIIFPGIGPGRGQYAFLMSKSRILMHFQLLIIVLSFFSLLFSWNGYAY